MLFEFSPNKIQHHQIKRDMNKARSIYAISPQSSFYTPIIDPPQRLPSSYNVDRQSEWQTSALISSAVETMTLPSRLRPHHDFEASLTGDDGIHKILELQSSILADNKDQPPSADKQSNGADVSNDDDGSSQVKTEFDIDFTYDSDDSKASHIFNQVQVTRGFDPELLNASAAEGITDIGMRRKQRFYNSQPMLQRYPSPSTTYIHTYIHTYIYTSLDTPLTSKTVSTRHYAFQS